MRKFFLFIIPFVCLFLMMLKVQAADPLARMMGGDEEQELLVLGEMESINEDSSIVLRSIFNFPSSKRKEEEKVIINNIQGAVYFSPKNLVESADVGKKYVVSLTKENEGYSPNGGFMK